MVCVTIGIVIIGTTVGSLTQVAAWASPMASNDRTPSSAIESALAIPRASSIDAAEVINPRAKSSCDDFEFSFLNSTCSKIRKKHAARRMIHRVATLVIGHPDASPSLRKRINSPEPRPTAN